MKRLIPLIILFFISFYVKAYQPFNDDEQFFLKHLKTKRYELDTSASAIVLYESGDYKIEVDAQYRLVVNQTCRRVIKILKRSGIRQGDISITYFSFGNNTVGAYGLSAKTYNLVDGKVVVNKLDNKVFSDEALGGYGRVLKFSHSSVDVGSVIDYTYSIKQPMGFNFMTWLFQDDLPVLFSEVKAAYYSSMAIAAVTKTSVEFETVDETKFRDMPDSLVPLAYTTVPVLAGKYNIIKWVRRNVPAIVDEPFVYNIDNYIQRVELYLAAASSLLNRNFSTWQNINQYFNKQIIQYMKLSGGAVGLSNILNDVDISNRNDSLTLARQIYGHVRDDFNKTGGKSVFPQKRMAKVLEEHRGNAVELNLLLVRLLRKAGFKADPVLQGTRNIMRLDRSYPMIDRINYVICRVEVNGQEYFLDATQKYNPFGVLNSQNYNGFAWVVSDDGGYEVNIPPSALRERNSTVITTLDPSAEHYTMKVQQVFGNMSGPILRKGWSNDTSNVKEFILKELKKSLVDIDLVRYSVKNIHEPEKKLIVTFVITFKWPENKGVNFIPALFNYYDENPFRSNERFMPIEMPASVDANFILKMDIPEGYMVTDLPEPGNIKLTDNDYYRYLVEYNIDEKKLVVSTKLVMKDTYFDAASYKPIQSFFDNVLEVEKQSCLISKNTD